MNFIEKHWGDLLALYIIHMGLFIIWMAHGDADLAHVGEGFILSGAMTLRFKVTQTEKSASGTPA